VKAISLPLWPEGRIHAVTFSYDDGRIQDRRVVETLNRYGLKGTFNLNGRTIGRENTVGAGEVRTLYAGHEVASHFFSHPYPTRIPPAQAAAEVLEDRRRLETLTGGVVDGMSYPYGDWNEEVIRTVGACGIRYARTTRATGRFDWTPEQWLAWHPTCHDRAAKPELLDQFFNTRPSDRNARLLYIWGHSYEFDRAGGWEAFDTLCRTLRERGGDRLWAATNGMLRDYADAARRLRFAAEGQTLANPSALDVWIAADGAPLRVPAGATLSPA
jgi:peptidoglycan-N-acetylglucosamine deacetylase